MMPHDLFQRRWYVRLRRQFPDVLERWFWIVFLAQNARAAGRICIGGEPATAEDVAIAWDRHATAEDVATWELVVAAFLGEGILVQSEDGLRISKPTSWYLPPSKQPQNRDFTGEWESRKDKANAARRTGSAREAHGKAREAHGKAREGTAKHVHSTSTSTSTSTEPVPNRTSTSTEPLPGSAGAGAAAAGIDIALAPLPAVAQPKNGNGKRSWANDVLATLAEHLPGELSAQERQAVARIAEAGERLGATPERAMAAIRKHAVEVAYEVQFPNHNIRYPRRIALERALHDIESSPEGPLPHEWDR